MCGNFDIPSGITSFAAADYCCICGYDTSDPTIGTTTQYVVTGASTTGENVATEYDVETDYPSGASLPAPVISVAMTGDADTYVIYPTTEKSLYRAG